MKPSVSILMSQGDVTSRGKEGVSHTFVTRAVFRDHRQTVSQRFVTGTMNRKRQTFDKSRWIPYSMRVATATRVRLALRQLAFFLSSNLCCPIYSLHGFLQDMQLD